MLANLKSTSKPEPGLVRKAAHTLEVAYRNENGRADVDAAVPPSYGASTTARPGFAAGVRRSLLP